MSDKSSVEFLGYCGAGGVLGLAAPSVNRFENILYKVITKDEAQERFDAYKALSKQEKLQNYLDTRDSILKNIYSFVASVNAFLPPNRDDNNVMPRIG